VGNLFWKSSDWALLKRSGLRGQDLTRPPRSHAAIKAVPRDTPGAMPASMVIERDAVLYVSLDCRQIDLIDLSGTGTQRDAASRTPRMTEHRCSGT